MRFPAVTAVQGNSTLIVSADFEVGEMTKSSEENNDHTFFERIAL